jgi:hypothetical protein
VRSPPVTVASEVALCRGTKATGDGRCPTEPWRTPGSTPDAPSHSPAARSSALLDRVAALIRSALRGLRQIAEAGLEAQLRAVLVSGDDYVITGKPQIE